jgi:hypothetical protein
LVLLRSHATREDAVRSAQGAAFFFVFLYLQHRAFDNSSQLTVGAMILLSAGGMLLSIALRQRSIVPGVDVALAIIVTSIVFKLLLSCSAKYRDFATGQRPMPTR